MYNRTKTKTYINILRHTFLVIGLINMYRKFNICMCHTKRGIDVQKIFMKNVYFQVSAIVKDDSLGRFQYKIYQKKGLIICYVMRSNMNYYLREKISIRYIKQGLPFTLLSPVSILNLECILQRTLYPGDKHVQHYILWFLGLKIHSLWQVNISPGDNPLWFSALRTNIFMFQHVTFLFF